jgi:hypothetical protein
MCLRALSTSQARPRCRLARRVICRRLWRAGKLPNGRLAEAILSPDAKRPSVAGKTRFARRAVDLLCRGKETKAGNRGTDSGCHCGIPILQDFAPPRRLDSHPSLSSVARAGSSGVGSEFGVEFPSRNRSFGFSQVLRTRSAPVARRRPVDCVCRPSPVVCRLSLSSVAVAVAVAWIGAESESSDQSRTQFCFGFQPQDRKSIHTVGRPVACVCRVADPESESVTERIGVGVSDRETGFKTFSPQVETRFAPVAVACRPPVPSPVHPLRCPS